MISEEWEKQRGVQLIVICGQCDTLYIGSHYLSVIKPAGAAVFQLPPQQSGLQYPAANYTVCWPFSALTNAFDCRTPLIVMLWLVASFSSLPTSRRLFASISLGCFTIIQPYSRYLAKWAAPRSLSLAAANLGGIAPHSKLGFRLRLTFHSGLVKKTHFDLRCKLITVDLFCAGVDAVTGRTGWAGRTWQLPHLLPPAAHQAPGPVLPLLLPFSPRLPGRQHSLYKWKDY